MDEGVDETVATDGAFVAGVSCIVVEVLEVTALAFAIGSPWLVALA